MSVAQGESSFSSNPMDDENLDAELPNVYSDMADYENLDDESSAGMDDFDEDDFDDDFDDDFEEELEDEYDINEDFGGDEFDENMDDADIGEITDDPESLDDEDTLGDELDDD